MEISKNYKQTSLAGYETMSDTVSDVVALNALEGSCSSPLQRQGVNFQPWKRVLEACANSPT
jgi:hypothetical protein